MLQVNLIPIHLIDEPELAMRTDINDERLRELADDIARNGLINAIAVTRNGERFKIEAGHRRYLACRLIGRTEIEAKDYTGSGIPAEAIKCSENLQQEKPSDADIAFYLKELVDVHHYDMERLQRVTGKSEHWIDERISLFRGDERVFHALREGKIILGHALELNKFPPDYINSYLDLCINSTPPVRVVKEWRQQVKLLNLPSLPETPQPTAEQPAVELPGFSVEPCIICKSAEIEWLLKYVRVHGPCIEKLLKALEQAERS